MTIPPQIIVFEKELMVVILSGMVHVKNVKMPLITMKMISSVLGQLYVFPISYQIKEMHKTLNHAATNAAVYASRPSPARESTRGIQLIAWMRK
mmetsp:Transcript_17805/g.38520  ORF Transcript_17805/g.38520 Transcript_17805/m.38520 type:complete len:94 (-) Transcript_17805:216-497(-)